MSVRVCECVTLTADITQEVNPETEDVRRVLKLEYVINCFVRWCFTVMCEHDHISLWVFSLIDFGGVSCQVMMSLVRLIQTDNQVR